MILGNYKLQSIIFSIILIGCGSQSTYHRGYESSFIDSTYIVTDIDTSSIKACLKPEGYQWNIEENFVELIRKRQQQNISNEYPNPFSPSTNMTFLLPSDTVKLFICNSNESVCVKISEEIYTQGLNEIGFQKITNAGKYILKLVADDKLYVKQLILVK